MKMLQRVIVVFVLYLLISPSWAGLPIGVIKLKIQPAPELRLKDLNGKVTDLKGYRGKWVMVHFWASWCRPCRKEMPKIQTMSKKLVPKYLELILVNTAENEDRVFDFLPFVAPDLKTLLDKDGKVTAAWGPRGLPSSFIVDPRGRLQYVAVGDRDWDTPEYMNFLRSLSKKR